MTERQTRLGELGSFEIGGRVLHRAAMGRIGLAGAFVWLLFIVFPLINAVANKGAALRHVLAIVGAAAFVAAYIALVVVWRRREGTAVPAALFAVLFSIATALTLFERPGWGFLFTYCAACTALISPQRVAVVGVAMCTAFAGATSALAGADGGTVLSFVATTAGIGLLMMLLRDLRVRNAELTEARAELAELAVAQERERFARDLHDLLGHSLSVIALKAELAGRLLPDRPREAAGEVAEVERVARGALSEVRQAVSGYRQPRLDDELEGARMALSAAGIETDLQRSSVSLAPAVEAVLAWAVREGATNVIRHSRAKHVKVRVSVGLIEAGVEVVDDGVGAGSVNGAGHGLAGLAERAEAVNGSVEAGALSEGGFRLAVTLPVKTT